MTEPLYRFRIHAARGKWRVETWEEARPEDCPAGCSAAAWANSRGWQPALTGALTIDEAREFFDGAAVLRWDDESRMTGVYTFAP